MRESEEAKRATKAPPTDRIPANSVHGVVVRLDIILIWHPAQKIRGARKRMISNPKPRSRCPVARGADAAKLAHERARYRAIAEAAVTRSVCLRLARALTVLPFFPVRSLRLPPSPVPPQYILSAENAAHVYDDDGDTVAILYDYPRNPAYSADRRLIQRIHLPRSGKDY